MQAAACDQCMQDPCTCASADGSNGEQRKRARVTEIESKDGDTVEETEDTATVMEERIPLPEWCHTAQWTLLPRTPEQIAWCSSEDAAEDSDGKFVVLPEAANVNPRRRAIVTLPSGAVMACMVSVLVKYCPTLRDKASDLLTNVIQLRYQPERSWSDEDVLGFFSLLHKFNTDQDAIQNSIVDPAWSALATALGIKEYVEFCQQTIQKKLEAGPPKVRDVARLARSTPPRSIQEITWKWIAAYRQFTDEETWRQSCLSYFLPMKFSLFRQYWAAEQRPRIAEMFSGSDLFALAYSRWNCWRQDWRWNPNKLVGKKISFVDPSWGEAKVMEYRESDGSHRVAGSSDNGDWGFYDLTKYTIKTDGRTYQPSTPPILPSKLEWATSGGQDDVTDQGPPRGDIPLHGADSLPAFLQLRLVVDDQLSFKCDFDTLQGLSCLVKEAVIDESGDIPTLYLPFAAGLPRHEVVEFFHMTHSRARLPSTWKYTWVQLADHLQMDAWLTAIGRWLWRGVAFEDLADWIASSRLQSMQARKPSTLAWSSTDTVTDEGVLKLLQEMRDDQLIKVFSGDGNRFAQLVGQGVLFEFLATMENKLRSELWSLCVL